MLVIGRMEKSTELEPIIVHFLRKLTKGSFNEAKNQERESYCFDQAICSKDIGKMDSNKEMVSSYSTMEMFLRPIGRITKSPEDATLITKMETTS